MKLSMLKLLMITALLSTSLLSNTEFEKKLIKFEKQRIAKSLERMNGKLLDVQIVLKKDIKQDGWIGYVMDLQFEIQGKKLSQKDTIFSNGKLIAFDLIDAKTKFPIKHTSMYPKLTDKYYDKKHLIAGNPEAKHKMVIFSDPLCPICIDEVPFIIKNIVDNPKNIALYYYHLPLQIHPTAKTISKASIIAKEKGVKLVDYIVYEQNFPEKYKFDAYKEQDHKKILDYFNKEFGTSITMQELNDPRLEKMIQYDIMMSDKAFVSGTPSVFFNGEYDFTRSKYKKFLK